MRKWLSEDGKTVLPHKKDRRENEGRKGRVLRHIGELMGEADCSFEEAKNRLRSGNPKGK